MRRTISSAQTFLMKVIFPLLWFGGFVAATVLLFLGAGGFTDSTGNPPPPEMKWTFLSATVGGGLFVYWSCVRLKRVALDDRALHISNYLKEIVVPLHEIEYITENRWLNIHPVTVHFYGATDFGSSIVFMPKMRWFAFFSSHPIVAELETAAAQARGANRRPPAA